MKICKKSLFVLSLLFFVLYSKSQNSLVMQKAFTDSYSFEYNKNYGNAIATLSKVYEANNYNMNLRLGWLSYLNKNYAQSVKFYSKAVALKRSSIEAKLGLVKPFVALENQDEAIKVYEDIIKLDDQNYSANYYSGLINYNQKKYDQALKYFEKITNSYPFDFDGNLMLAWTYLNLTKNDQAKYFFNTAFLISPNNASCVEGLSKLK